ncbi:hypothetical protein ACHAXR_009409 [Thalassiosira sp. AJA248-18]
MRKKQKRTTQRAGAIGSAAIDKGTYNVSKMNGVDIKKLTFMLSIISVIMISVAIIMKTHIDVMTEEVLRTKYGDANDAPAASDPAKKMTPQQQKTIIDPSQFKGVWDMNMHFSKNYDSKGLHTQLKQMFDPNERAYDPSKRRWRLNSAYSARGAGFDRTTRHKLVHDLEQFDYYLRSKEVGMEGHGLELFRSTLPKLYRATLLRLDQAANYGDLDEENEFYNFQKQDREIMNYYNRALFLPPLQLVQGSLLASRDWGQVEREWLGEDNNYPHPGIVVIDNLLSPQTLIRAYLNDGMHDSVMTEIALELHKAMPRVMKSHAFKEMWSYKYESSSHDEEERTGIHVHADDAMINVNLWITPDEANLDPNSGGLIVYTVKPPREGGFSSFNSNWEYIDEHLLRPSGYANVTVPYKQNRAVIFDSFLFHKSDKHKFKREYENRRINLTFLYGDKQSVESSDGGSINLEDKKKEL